MPVSAAGEPDEKAFPQRLAVQQPIRQKCGEERCDRNDDPHVGRERIGQRDVFQQEIERYPAQPRRREEQLLPQRAVCALARIDGPQREVAEGEPEKQDFNGSERLKEYLCRNEGRAPDDDGHEGQHMAECGFVFHACLPPKISAYCRGVTPMSRLKKREKWLWSAKPVWSATSIIGTFRSSSFRALAMRMVSRYRYGEMPFCLVNERRR